MYLSRSACSSISLLEHAVIVANFLELEAEEEETKGRWRARVRREVRDERDGMEVRDGR